PESHDEGWLGCEALSSGTCRPPGDGESLKPQVARQHHRSYDGQRESGYAQPSGRRRLKTINSDEGEHEHDEAGKVDDLGSNEDWILRSVQVPLLVECPHDGLGDEEERSRSD